MRRPARDLGALLVLVIVYFGAGKLGLSLAVLHASASAVWPPTGLALAALLLWGYRLWPAVFAGAFLVNWTTAGSFGTSVAIAAGNTVEAVAGAWLAHRFARGVGAFDRALDLFRFVFFAAAPSTALSATIGVTSLALGGYAAWNNFASIWLTWWTGDFVSDLVVAPLLLIWLSKSPPSLERHQSGEAAALLLSVLAVSWIVFGGVAIAGVGYPLEYLGVPLLLWAAFRFLQHGAVTCSAAMSAVAVWCTLRRLGPFAVTDPNTSLLLLQTFVAVITLTALALAALVAETERAQKERETLLGRAEAARAEAERANRAKDDFLAALSHELRTPLTPVLLTAAMLEDDPALPDRVRQDARTIRHNVELEARLIDDLLDLSRITSGKMSLSSQTVGVHELLRSVGEMMRAEVASKSLKLDWDLRAEDDVVWGDPARLQQVLWNLVQNAVKFTPAGGAITIHSRNERSGRLAVEVRDSGIGIPADRLVQIFEPFYQVGDSKGRSGGLGLGLTISSTIAKMHGGKLAAESEGEGRGAKFTLTLPNSGAADTRHPPEQVTASATLDRVPRLLLVEDHPDTLGALRRLLEQEGFVVATAATVAAGTKLLDAHPFDVLVSDVGLPDGSGHDLMRHVRDKGLHVRGVALTGYGMAEDLDASRLAGFAAHLTKPVDVKRLVAAIRDIAEEH
jgi:signal transduction histidine kinase